MAATVQVWLEFASTYSYPAAMRVETAAKRAGVALELRPFLLGPIFRAQGWNDSPFNIYPAKGRYMWRDLERVCAKHGLPLRRPSHFPRSGLLAARVALLGAAEPWGPDFVRAVYRANFAEDRNISDLQGIWGILETLGQKAGDVLDQASSPENKERLRLQTDEAIRLGIFGAPSFTVGEELYWGNDRLEDAIAFARDGRLTAR
jgi:2-hydroxychromene-2-carboxylate isomerase